MTDIKKGDRVVIAEPISQMEKDLLGEQLWYYGSEPTHGYAKVQDKTGAIWWVHPESLKGGIVCHR